MFTVLVADALSPRPLIESFYNGFEPAAYGLPAIALPLELERMSHRMLNFGYLNPATCFFYGVIYYCNPKAAGSNPVGE